MGKLQIVRSGVDCLLDTVLTINLPVVYMVLDLMILM
jgi:hypothetical protein